jgi:hypothetical protein
MYIEKSMTITLPEGQIIVGRDYIRNIYLELRHKGGGGDSYIFESRNELENLSNLIDQWLIENPEE